tara:strand:+ start:1478 stop:1660 length:183 start_codon:yes stop_codon:yes gene_type:complete
MKKTEDIKQLKTLLKDVFEMSFIRDDIDEMIKDGCKTEDDIEHCYYLIQLKNEVEEVLKK